MLFNTLGKEVDVESFDTNDKLFFENQLTLNQKIVIDKNKIDEEHESVIIDESSINPNFSVHRSGRRR